jgi:hypothetical protein
LDTDEVPSTTETEDRPDVSDSSDDVATDSDDIFDGDDGDDEGEGVAVGVEGCGDSSQWTHAEFPSRKCAFSAYSGPPCPQVRLESCFDFFSLVFPVELFSDIATQTNLYAKQKLMASGVSEDRVAEKFEPTTADEIKAYIGLLMYMNIASIPDKRLYWSDGPYYNPFVAGTMPCERFERLAMYLHLADSSLAVEKGQPGFDPLQKVRPLLSKVQESFERQFLPGENITVDEAMIRFKGRCGFLQYLPAKPTKWGMKVWSCCDADSFYMLRLSLYTGKTNDVPAGSGDALGDRVVKHLCDPLLRQWHTIYFDNYFTSVSLMKYLYDRDTLAAGTVRNNRKGLPDGMRPAKCVKKSGDTLRWFQRIGADNQGKLQAIAWFDRRKVTLLTTAHGGSDGEVVRKGPGGVEKARYSRPQAVAEYTRNYNGVDKHDQMRSYYGSTLRFSKWWKYVLLFCLDSAAVNAYIIYKQSAAAPLKGHLEFQTQVIMGMINGYKGRKRIGRTPLNRDPAQMNRHTPSKIESARGRRVCVVCAKEGRKTDKGYAIQSYYECVKCKVTLCKDRGCFRTFHQ